MIKRLVLIIPACGLVLLSLLPGFQAAAQTPDPLRDDLISCWDMDESSGTRYDAYGDNDLTDNNTVGSAGGVVGNAASFDSANSEYLSHVSNSSLQMGDINYSIVLWSYLYANDYRQSYVGKIDEYGLTFDHGNIYTGIGELFYLKFGSTVKTISTHNTNTWYMISGIYDTDNNTMSLVINTTVYSSTATSATSTNSNAFEVGKWGTYTNGRIDQLLIIKRALTQEEVTWLYNSGSGRSCAEVINYPPPPTPTPSGQRQVNLSSGDWVTLKRETTYGDISLVVVLGALGLLLGIPLTILVINRWYVK